jgi:hypothetical protein
MVQFLIYQTFLASFMLINNWNIIIFVQTTIADNSWKKLKEIDTFTIAMTIAVLNSLISEFSESSKCPRLQTDIPSFIKVYI